MTMKVATQQIPDILIYEMVAGLPIYYKGYKAYLKGNKQIDEIMGSSYLQGALATQLILHLGNLIDLNSYRIISNEIGLKFSKSHWRAADLAIFDLKSLKNIPLNNKYIEVAPKIVIEIDTKAELDDDLKNPLGYFQEKTDDLLAFGVEKVIWIFTETQKVMVAEKNQAWKILHWNNSVNVLKDVEINVFDLVENLRID